MMNPTRLGGLLALQLFLMALTWWPTNDATTSEAPFGDDSSAISAVHITVNPDEGAEASTLVLERDNQIWRIASEAGYPADPAKVERLLDKLTAMRLGPVIGSSKSSHNALEVGDESWGRKLEVVIGGEAPRRFVVGPARSDAIHLREEDSDVVHEVRGLSEWALDGSPSSYWNGLYVDADPDRLLEVRVENAHGRFALVRSTTDKAWALAEPEMPEGRSLDSAAVESLLGEITKVKLGRPLEAPSASFGPEADRVSWVIAAEDATVTGGFSIAPPAEGEGLEVRSDTGNAVIRAAEDDVGAAALRDVALQKLLRVTGPGDEGREDG